MKEFRMLNWPNDNSSKMRFQTQYQLNADTKTRNASNSGRLFLILLLTLATFTGCSESPTKIPPSPLTMHESPLLRSDYKLDVGDVLDIKFFYNPELSDSATIRPDGKVRLQLVGELPAKGLTPKKLEQTIIERYRGIVRHPEIAVILRKFTPQKIFVGGEVTTPGVVPMEGRVTALQAIMSVGGFKSSAQLDSIVILKNNGQKNFSYQILDLQAHLDREALQDVELNPFDVVFVPKTKISEIATFFKENINEIFPFYKNSGITFPFMYYLNPGAITGVTK
jgi:polysaccharide biosynthesis/export protein